MLRYLFEALLVKLRLLIISLYRLKTMFACISETSDKSLVGNYFDKEYLKSAGNYNTFKFLNR